MQIVFFLLLVGNSRMVQCRGGEMLSIVEYIRHIILSRKSTTSVYKWEVLTTFPG